MKYVITGSTGHISKPVAQQLLAAGHQVTVVTSNAAKVAEIEALGAKAAVGSVEDRTFLTQAFAGADAVYLMIPPKWDVTDWLGYQKQVADNYIAAVTANHTPNVVILSSLGAHMRKGAGPVDGAGYLEEQATKVAGTNFVALRPSYFYYNLFGQIGAIKHMGFITSAQPGSHKLVLTHTDDIADVAADRLLKLDFTGFTIQNIGSDDSHTWDEVAKILGAAIGKPELPYVESTDEQSRQGLLQAGLSPVIVEGYVAMGQALRSGKMEADYWQNRPAKLGKVKLADFAKEFAAAYNAA